LHLLDQMLVFPTGDPAFLAGGAAILQRAAPARVRPVATQLQTVLIGRVSIGQLLLGRAAIDVASVSIRALRRSPVREQVGGAARLAC